MTETCIQLIIAGVTPSLCIGKICGQYNQCHGIITVHKPKVSVRKIENITSRR